jgi:uncharacterized phiE125 gp8 family phage protein
MTPDSSKYLVSLDDMRSYLGFTDTDTERDEVLGYLLTIVSEFADTYTRRTLLEAEHSEYYDGTGTETLMLNNYPVSAVHSLVIDYVGFTSTEVADTSEYRVDSDRGMVTYQYTWPRGTRNIKAVYTAGYTLGTVPFDLRLAVLEMTSHLWQRRNEKLWAHETRQGGDKSITVLREMPYTAKQILDRYYRWR